MKKYLIGILQLIAILGIAIVVCVIFVIRWPLEVMWSIGERNVDQDSR